MKILIACEFSGIVRDAFAARGHDAWSCDLLPTEKPGQHIQGDVLDYLNGMPTMCVDGGIDFKWDLMIAHPPCRYLTYAALKHWNQKGREQKRKEAMAFFMKLWKASIGMICIENPMGLPNTVFRSADQTIHPYFFGEPHLKRTCLWLKNLPLLEYKKTIIEKPEPLSTHLRSKSKLFKGGELKKNYFAHKIHGWKNRSRFWPGIAKAMAEQWG